MIIAYNIGDDSIWWMAWVLALKKKTLPICLKNPVFVIIVFTYTYLLYPNIAYVLML